MGRNLKRGIIISVALATGALWLSIQGLLLGWYPDLQRRVIVYVFDRAFDARVELGAAEGSLVEGMTLVDLQLIAREDAAPLLAISRAEVKLDLSSGFDRRQLIVQSIRLTGLNLSLTRDESGSWLVEGMSGSADPTAESPVDFTIEVRRIEVVDAAITASWRDETAENRIVLHGDAAASRIGWSTEMGMRMPGELTGKFFFGSSQFDRFRIESGEISFERAQSQIDIRLEQLSLSGDALGDFEVSGQAALIDAPSGLQMISGAAEVQFSELDLSAISQGRQVDSSLRGEVKLKLPEHDPEEDSSALLSDLAFRDFELELELAPCELANHPIESGFARLHYRPNPGVWRIEYARLSGRDFSLEISGNGTLERIEAIAIAAHGLSLEALLPASGSEFDASGSLDLTADLSGPIDDLRGSVSLVGDEIRFFDLPALEGGIEIDLLGDQRLQINQMSVGSEAPGSVELKSVGPWTLSRRGQSIHVEDLALMGEHGSFKLSGSFESGEFYDVRVDFDSIQLAAWARSLGREPELLGMVSGALDLAGPVAAPRLNGEVVFVEPAYSISRADTIRVQLQSLGEALKLSAKIEVAEQAPIILRTRLPYPLAALRPERLLLTPGFELSVAIDAFGKEALAAYVPSFKEALANTAGELTARVEFRGATSAPAVSGTVAWRNARLGPTSADQVRLVAQSKSGVLGLSLSLDEAGRNVLSGEASLNLLEWLESPGRSRLNPDNFVELSARTLELGWLLPGISTGRLGEIQRMSGRVEGAIELRGGADGIAVDGDLKLVDARVEMMLLEEPIGPIDGQLHISNSQIELRNLTVASSAGSARVKGVFRFNPEYGEALEVVVKFDDFALSHLPLLDARVKGDLEIVGELDSLNATGGLVFGKVRVDLPDPRDPLLREVRIRGLEGATSADTLRESKDGAPTYYETLSADIDIVVKDGARIRKRGANLVASGHVKVRKWPMKDAVLLGSLQTTRGTFAFFGREYEVTQGVATFDGRTPPDPDLNLEAMRRVNDVRVGVQLTGRWSNPQSRLVSEPQMDDTEILSYLVFEKKSSELGENDEIQRDALAAQVAGNLLLSQLSQQLPEGLPIDRVGLQLDEDLSAASMQIETHVGDNIIVRYERGLQAGIGDRVTVEWRFWKSLSARSEYSTGDASGVDLFWSFEY